MGYHSNRKETDGWGQELYLTTSIMATGKEGREGGKGKGRRKGGEVLGKDLETLEALDAASKNVKWHSLYGK